MNKTPKQKGFSLLELLAVLVLLGFMAGVTGPSVGRFLDSMDFKKQTNKVLAAFRYARLQSVAKGKNVSVSLSDDGKGIKLAGGISESRAFNLDFDDTLELDPEEITFYPEGQVTPGTITINRGERKISFNFDPLTGLTIPEEI